MSGTGENELAFAGPLELARRVRAREISARELVQLSLARIERLDPSLNAFREVLGEAALDTASQIDDRASAAASAPAGVLAGVPIAVKDDMPFAGHARTQGSRSPAQPEPRDAEPLRRMREAGAIPVGITRVPELMLSPWTASEAGGITRNPWDLTRTPGGSSGGSAAAVAAGLVPAAGGSDGGGSIRIPAACCGLVGMKPTRGRVPSEPLSDETLGLSTFGALARTVADSALLLDVMHGSVRPDDGVASPRGSFLQAAQTPPARPLRVALSSKLPLGVFARLSADQRRALDQTARLLAELGHQVTERDPSYGLVSLEFIQTFLRAAHEGYESLERPDLAERSTRQLAAIGGRVVSTGRRERLLAKRPATIARITRLWDDHDVLLTPGLARTAIAAEGAYGRSAPVWFDRSGRFMPWYPVFNLTGQPAISIPAGFGTDGLPLSVQLVGRHGAEETLYSLAGQIEAARPWASERPPMAVA